MARAWPRVIDPAQDLGEQGVRHRYLGHRIHQHFREPSAFSRAREARTCGNSLRRIWGQIPKDAPHLAMTAVRL
jgi:hypothetical protein